MSTPFFVSAAGRRIRAVRLGEWRPDMPVLVFLHEGLGSIGQWHDFPARLAAATKLPALVYERYGYGDSEPLDAPRPSDFLEREAFEALPDVLAACDVERPLLFGHSDGGTIALLYASAFPDLPVAVITEAAHVFVENETHGSLQVLRERWAHDEQLRTGLARYHGEGAEPMFFGWTDTWLRPENLAWKMLDRLPAIRCPVLAIQGEDDAHGTREQVKRIASGISGPAEELMIPDCGHVPHKEKKATVLAESAAFVARAVAREPRRDAADRTRPAHEECVRPSPSGHRPPSASDP